VKLDITRTVAREGCGSRGGGGGPLRGPPHETQVCPPFSVLQGKETIPKDDEIIYPVKNQDKLKLRELNEDAYEDLILSIEGDGKAGHVAFQLVKGSKMTELKDGDAAFAWSRLANKYQPTSTPSRLEIIEEFNNCKIKSWKQDPSTWITELDDFRTRINETGGSKSEIDMLEHILINMPKEYNDLYTKYHSQVGASNDPLS
jgi:hypothetical protein